MTSLRKIVEKKKCEKYAWPEGWMTKEQAANDLGVAPRDVDDMLKEAIRDGDVERKQFTVYDARQGRTVRQPGYRVADKDTPRVETPKRVTRPIIDREERIKAAILNYPGLSNSLVSRHLFKVTARDVAEVRAKMQQHGS